MSFLDGWQLYLLSEWFIRVVMLLVIPPRRSPQAAKSWLILVLFLPWPGLLVYWLVGRMKLPKWRYQQFAKIPESLSVGMRRLVETVSSHTAELQEPWAVPGHLARNLGYFRPLNGNSAELLSDYDQGLRKLEADIDSAKSHVHLLFYIFALDKSTVPILAALARATARGVECRALYDAVGSSKWKADLLPALQKAGVEAREVMPVNLFFGKGLRADLRNHRKIAVIDGTIGYTGSQNLVEAEFSPGLYNEELMVRVTGPVVSQLQFVFTSDWFLETEEALTDAALFPRHTTDGSIIAQVLPSGPDYDRQNNEHLIITLCHYARKKIVLTTPYFIPSEPLVEALQAATLRGVEVHVFVSRKSDNFLTSWAQASYYEELLESGARLYLYQRNFLHAKHMSFDDSIAWVGSSNLDIRSFELNAEINVLFYGVEVAGKLSELHSRYLRNCELMDLELWRQRPLLLKMGENLARLWSPLL
jgi:cardiolipin synthase A/B